MLIIFFIVSHSTETEDKEDKDPRDVTQNSFNRFDPKYVSIGPKTPKANLTTNKCATLKHSGRFGGGGSISPNPKLIPQPIVQSPIPELSHQHQLLQTQQQIQQVQQQIQQAQQQHIQLQQHHLQKPNNQQLELQTYQLQQQNYQPQNYNISTVSREYQSQQYQSGSYKKPGTGFTETSSILKKHREEVSELAKPSVFSIDPSMHSRQHESLAQTKPVSIINQPLPEIPTQQSASAKNPQVLCASNLTGPNYPTNYRSLQRPQPTKASFNTGTTQRSRDSRPGKVLPPILPPKNRNQRAQQPLPAIPIHSYNQQQQQLLVQSYQSRNYDRERSRERDRNSGRSYDDSHQFKSSKQLQQQQMLQQLNFQTLPHHHHHPQTTTTFSSGTNTGIKNNRKLRGSRELLQQPFENYSATEL